MDKAVCRDACTKIKRTGAAAKATTTTMTTAEAIQITRPDTRQSSRGRLGRSGNAKTARNLTKFVTDIPTYRPTDRHGKV